MRGGGYVCMSCVADVTIRQPYRTRFWILLVLHNLVRHGVLAD